MTERKAEVELSPDRVGELAVRIDADERRYREAMDAIARRQREHEDAVRVFLSLEAKGVF